MQDLHVLDTDSNMLKQFVKAHHTDGENLP